MMCNLRTSESNFRLVHNLPLRVYCNRTIIIKKRQRTHSKQVMDLLELVYAYVGSSFHNPS